MNFVAFGVSGLLGVTFSGLLMVLQVDECSLVAMMVSFWGLSDIRLLVREGLNMK